MLLSMNNMVRSENKGLSENTGWRPSAQYKILVLALYVDDSTSTGLLCR